MSGAEIPLLAIIGWSLSPFIVAALGYGKYRLGKGNKMRVMNRIRENIARHGYENAEEVARGDPKYKETVEAAKRAALSAAREVLDTDYVFNDKDEGLLLMAIKAASEAARAEFTFAAARHPVSPNANLAAHRAARDRFSSMSVEELQAFLIANGRNAGNVRYTTDRMLLQRMARKVVPIVAPNAAQKGGYAAESSDDPLEYLFNEETLSTIFRAAIDNKITSEEDAFELAETNPDLIEIMETLQEKLGGTNNGESVAASPSAAYFGGSRKRSTRRRSSRRRSTRKRSSRR